MGEIEPGIKMIAFILAHINTIQMIFLSLIGAFIGEFFRATCTSPTKVSYVIAEFLASALFAYILTVCAAEFGVKSKAILTVLPLYTGFIGYKVTSKYAKKIFDNILLGVVNTSKPKAKPKHTAKPKTPTKPKPKK